MAFAVEDYADLLRLLDSNPEWKADLRRRVLDDEFLSLPALVRQNSVDIGSLQEAVRQNSVDIAANTAAIDRLEQSVAANTAAIGRLEQSVAALERAVARLEQSIDKLLRSQVQMFGRLGSAEGEIAELRWTRHFDGRFSSLIRRARVVTVRDLPLFDQADEDDRISDSEARAVRNLDLIIEGVRGKKDSAVPILLAVEISNRVEAGDVNRARDRAAILRKAGYNAIPVVAGSLIDDGLAELARAQGIEVLLRPDDIARPAIDLDLASGPSTGGGRSP